MSKHTEPSTASSPASATLLQRVLQTDTAMAPLLLRLSLGVVVFPHGAQKLLGWFGGYGFSGTMGFFTGAMGLPWLLAFGVILTEFFGSLLLVFGLGTRLAALAIGTVMASAMVMVHLPNGFFMNWFGTQKGEGIEYFLLAIGISLALMLAGGGRGSLDRLVTRR
jgi:putative oxidoreductase